MIRSRTGSGKIKEKAVERSRNRQRKLKEQAVESQGNSGKVEEQAVERSRNRQQKIRGKGSGKVEEVKRSRKGQWILEKEAVERCRNKQWNRHTGTGQSPRTVGRIVNQSCKTCLRPPGLTGAAYNSADLVHWPCEGCVKDW